MLYNEISKTHLGPNVVDPFSKLVPSDSGDNWTSETGFCRIMTVYFVFQISYLICQKRKLMERPFAKAE